MNANPTPIKRKRLGKKDQMKEEKTNNNIFMVNALWNDWKFQIHWHKLELLDLKKRNIKKNIYCSSTHKLYIKYGKQEYHITLVDRSEERLPV